MELVRLAIPRRVYTQSHIDYVIEGIVEQAPFLRHFTARFAPLG
jgi:tryptophanase